MLGWSLNSACIIRFFCSCYNLLISVQADVVGRRIATESGNEIVDISLAEKAKWVEAVQPVIDGWIAEMDGKGLDGAGLVAAARSAIANEK